MEDLSHYNPEGSTLRRAQLRMLEILKVVFVKNKLIRSFIIFLMPMIQTIVKC
jgi:hypothetical protein